MEKTIKDIVEKSHNAYKGKFWNRHIKEFQSWEGHMKWLKEFEQFCSRMWLDNEEENLSPLAAGNRLSKSKYIENVGNDLLFDLGVKLDPILNRTIKIDAT